MHNAYTLADGLVPVAVTEAAAYCKTYAQSLQQKEY
jgi:hypothetical protein